eukprot:scaffold318955_cov21-Tisochrysis_lutea.AAC.1
MLYQRSNEKVEELPSLLWLLQVEVLRFRPCPNAPQKRCSFALAVDPASPSQPLHGGIQRMVSSGNRLLGAQP